MGEEEKMVGMKTISTLKFVENVFRKGGVGGGGGGEYWNDLSLEIG